MKRNRKTRQSLSYGTLEPKRLLAGNVNANVLGEHIYIRGDQQDNQIRIFASGGKIRVQGLNGTSINNRFGSVTVDNSTIVSSNNRIGSEFNGGLRVHMGPGNDSIEVDGIRLNQLSIIYGGTGNDDVNIEATDFTSAIVQTFTGDDRVTISDTKVTDSLFALTLDGDDSLTLENSESLGGAILATGIGNDALTLSGNQHLGARQLALTEDGDDTIEILNPNVGIGSLEVYTGNGDDEVSGEIITGDIGGRVVIAGQGDTDIARVEVGSNVANQVALRGFEFDGEIVFQNANRVDYGFAAFSKPDDSFFVADFVEFRRTTRISSIEWLGSYENSNAPLTGDRIVIDIYEGGFVDDPTIGEYQAPVGNPLASFNIGNNANRVDTGLTWSNFDGPRKIFSYSADIDFTMDPIKQYWISIYSMPTADQGPDFNNDFYILAEDVPLTDFYNGAANVKWPTIPDWYPNTSAKTHFTLRS
jgi:hypothetical protein